MMWGEDGERYVLGAYIMSGLKTGLKTLGSWVQLASAAGINRPVRDGNSSNLEPSNRNDGLGETA
jgi:hypothetical protein